MAEQGVSIGVDLGGTKIEAVVFERRTCSVLARERIETRRERGYEHIVATVADLIADMAKGAGLDVAKTPVGVGMPGSVTRRAGLVKNSNTVCLNGRPFRDDLSRRVGRPITFANDANCFALAEARLGAGRAFVEGIVFGVIMGSGVGGGIVIGGKVWSGLQNIGGEWGHHAVGPRVDASNGVGETPHRTGVAASSSGPARSSPPVAPRSGVACAPLGLRPRCYCGKLGCLELYLGGPFIEAEYERRADARRALAEIASRRSDDPHAADVLEESLDAFGRGLANVIDILDPTAVVLGGGVSNLDFFYTEGVERVKKYVFNDELETPILRHEVGDSAGVLGAALLDDNG
jgi:fructokinase